MTSASARPALLPGILLWGLSATGLSGQEPARPPFDYVRGAAFHVLSNTHNQESGYFSLSEGLDGRIHIGTAKYGENAYLVEFDPKTGSQRVVLDVNEICGLKASGYAAQAKIHTRNFVGPSGRVYIGSKQGYRLDPNDPSEYRGGYVMVYDPARGRGENLGMPYPGQGVIDVVADESRGLLYVVTCEDQHWMVYDSSAKTYRELGPRLTPYATTLIDGKGRANALTPDLRLTRYNPDTGNLSVRPVRIGPDTGNLSVRPVRIGKRELGDGDRSVVTWVLALDRRRAYLIRLGDPSLIEIDLDSDGEFAPAIDHGPLIDGKGYDSRCALTVAPDGRLYALVRVDNESGFGSGYLHHLLRFDPRVGRSVDLGVLAVKNPDFFDFSASRPWTHGFHRLPDGTLTPLHHHLALLAARDGSLYATILYPFTLLHIDRAELIDRTERGEGNPKSKLRIRHPEKARDSKSKIQDGKKRR